MSPLIKQQRFPDKYSFKGIREEIKTSSIIPLKGNKIIFMASRQVFCLEGVVRKLHRPIRKKTPRENQRQ